MELSEVIINTSRRPATYVVGPANGSYLYKGSARDLQQRLKDHHAGLVSRTKNRKPLHLLFFRYFETYAEARAFENYLKSGLGREWLRSNYGRRNPVDCSAKGGSARGGKSAGISLRRFESFSLHHSLPTVRCNFPKSSSTPHGDRRLRSLALPRHPQRRHCARLAWCPRKTRVGVRKTAEATIDTLRVVVGFLLGELN
jgi:putative endonuclease